MPDVGQLVADDGLELILIEQPHNALGHADAPVPLGPAIGEGVGDIELGDADLRLGQPGPFRNLGYHLVQFRRFFFRYPLYPHWPAHDGRADKILEEEKAKADDKVRNGATGTHPGPDSGNDPVENAEEKGDEQVHPCLQPHTNLPIYIL